MLTEIGVTQVTIPLPFRLNHVNCFLAEGPSGWMIIDAGLNNSVSRDIWNPIIEKYDIKDIILTHYHPDHFGYAGTLQQLTNAEVWMTEIDAEAGLSYWEPDSIKTVNMNYDTCGFPENLSNVLTTDEKGFNVHVKPYPTVQHYLEEGMKFSFGKYEYEVIFTPGHSDGLITLFNKENSILFSTDHILPKISPNISYWFRGNRNPLQSYMTSLEKIERLNVEYVIPSHGKPFRNANQRIEELLAHHHERLEMTYDSIKKPATIYEVNTMLFKNLNIHETRFAVGETLAHLEHLHLNNQSKKIFQDGTWYYEAI
ncbi:MBL fold metallo-hydrolase [Bacillus sp. OK048]|uniref:MBL fold metallo-hydrolase n=1 Tax=Bacillus sp. OK048 TaxID=1882761 RepID=UPI00088DEFF4|nr:MBL fold metallo-hydrolase [Bacillus sp. OK048]SDN31973.1 Glyoxylase, beta-lactamase superfamily II [Bacillus sp. OK048]